MLYGILSMPYEMAMSDELSRFQFYKTVQKLLEKDSQQQAEIEALKSEIVNIEKNTDYWADKANWIKKNEPVAWIDKNTGKPRMEGFIQTDHDIPLYTHPVKEFFEDEPQAEELHEILQSNAELTDEEIEECCCFFDVRLHHRYEPNAVLKDIEWTVTGIKDFVEAILRKAQEK